MRRFYARARQASERALYTDMAFRNAIDQGMPFKNAARHLSPCDFEPLFLRSTAVFYTFRDVSTLFEKISSRPLLDEAAALLRIMLEKEPVWGSGSLQFSLGIYYLSLPKIAGGDRQRAISLINEAVLLSERSLLPRWGRAKYLAVALGDRQLFVDDLQWVVNQDPLQLEGPAIWNAYFKEDARRMLEEREKYF